MLEETHALRELGMLRQNFILRKPLWKIAIRTDSTDWALLRQCPIKKHHHKMFNC